MRIDVFITQNGYADSRTKAKTIIEQNRVSVNGKTVTKPSFEISDNDDCVVLPSTVNEYVGRGGLKLEKALDVFNISPEGLVCADIGASTGGFTECLLLRGAKKVYAVDSGTNQLAKKLRNNSRVISLEGVNARALTCDSFGEKVSLTVMDVSFISQTLIFPAIKQITKENCDIITLVKPQFEVGKGGIGKHGIVKDQKKRIDALNSVIEKATQSGFKYISHITSPITGGDGNVEYLLHLKTQ